LIQTVRAYGGMVTAPHHLAAQAGLRVLNDGGNAIEAMIAAASTIAVVYPHMNALGGDNFWLVGRPGEAPIGIDACGGAAALANIEFYENQGLDQIPDRGPLAALTVAGAVSGWAEAFEFSRQHWEGRLPVARLLEDAIYHAENGVAVTETFARNSRAKIDQLRDQPGFANTFLNAGAAYAEGERLEAQKLAATLDQLAHDGLHDFYRGDLASSMAADLEKVGSPLRRSDLERHQARRVDPLSLKIRGHTVYNMPPPTQGLASLMLLGVFERLKIDSVDDAAYIHALVESTKAAFRVRDRYITDPDYMEAAAERFLGAAVLDELTSGVDAKKASPWPDAQLGGDTVWLGGMDADGRTVSFIQSIYWEFGSGVVLEGSGVLWQNRGTSFSLDDKHHNCLKPFRRPFHTIQPAMATLDDGRLMAYGTMGGEGQPQTQAMIFSRHALFGQPLQQAVNAPRWLLGRTWGENSTSLKIESRFDAKIIEALKAAGHQVELVGDFEEMMGHAGALVYHPNGLIEGASDPRSDGLVAAC